MGLSPRTSARKLATMHDTAAAQALRLWLADDPLFEEHRPPSSHPERPERLAAARRATAAVEAQGVLLERLPPRDVTEAEVLAAHAPSLLETLATLDGLQATVDADTFVSPRSVSAARRAAGAALSLVDGLLDGFGPRRGAALLRPPGHHATRDRAMGFCLLNNVAIAAHAALRRGVQRVAIVDFDVHHGNGTQDVFWRDPRVLYVSLHQWPLYPGTGAFDEVGEGEGKGATLNVPLSAGADDSVYAMAFEHVVVPTLSAFDPGLILVSAGFDAHARDPLAAMKLSERAYGHMLTALGKVADASAEGRLGLLLEGGYDLAALEGSLVASLRAMAGLALADGAPDGPTSVTHSDEIARARRIASRAFPAG